MSQEFQTAENMWTLEIPLGLGGESSFAKLRDALGRDAMPKEKAMPLVLRAWWVLLVPRVLFKCY